MTGDQPRGFTPWSFGDADRYEAGDAVLENPPPCTGNDTSGKEVGGCCRTCWAEPDGLTARPPEKAVVNGDEARALTTDAGAR